MAWNSPEVDRAFATLQVSRLSLLVSLSQNSPYAVLGLNREYRIEDISWTEVGQAQRCFEGGRISRVSRFRVPDTVRTS
jgi:hypothetical protein